MLTIATYPPMDAGFNSLPSRTMLDAGVFKHPALGSITRAVRGMTGCSDLSYLRGGYGVGESKPARVTTCRIRASTA